VRAVIDGRALGDRGGDDVIQAVGRPHLIDRGESAAIHNELHTRAGPVREQIGQIAASRHHQDGGLEVLVTDRVVEDGDAGVGLELLEDLVERCAAQCVGEVMHYRDVTLALLGQNRDDTGYQESHNQQGRKAFHGSLSS